MPTDDERRDVARRLRSFVTDDSVYADVDACHVLYSIGLYYKDVDRIYFSGFDVARLADLIEPSGHGCVPGECPINVRHDNDKIDRDALLEEVKELEKCAWYFGLDFDEDEPLRDRLKEASEAFAERASRIREAMGVIA